MRRTLLSNAPYTRAELNINNMHVHLSCDLESYIKMGFIYNYI